MRNRRAHQRGVQRALSKQPRLLSRGPEPPELEFLSCISAARRAVSSGCAPGLFFASNCALTPPLRLGGQGTARHSVLYIRPQHAHVPIELDHRLAPAVGIGCVDCCLLASGAPSGHEQQRGGGSRAGGGIWPGEARPHASRGQGCLGCHNQRVILPPPTVCLRPSFALISLPRACKCLSCCPARPTLASERACGASWLTADAIKWRGSRCAIKQQYEPLSHGDYVSEQWQVPARALRKGANVLVWDYLRGSTTHYWLQSIRLFSDAPPIFPHPPTLEPRTTERKVV